MKTVVVGGAGFIGSNIVDILIEKNHTVMVVDDLSTGKIENINKEAQFVKLDICSDNAIAELEKIFSNVDVVFHTAALPRVEPSIINPTESHKINIDGTYNVFWAAKNSNVGKIVFSSSSSIYGNAPAPTAEEAVPNPMSPYALQKLNNEQYAKLFCDLYNMNITCLRYFNVYGNREPKEGSYVPVVGIWLKQYQEGKPLTITGDGKQSRDFINVFDVARANIMSAMSGQKGYRVYNVGSGETNELNVIANLISADIKYIPERNEPKFTLADVTKIKHDLGWCPTITIKEYVNSIKQRFNNEKYTRTRRLWTNWKTPLSTFNRK